MEMSAFNPDHHQRARQLFNEGRNFKAIEAHLSQEGVDECTICEVIKQLKSLHYAKKSRRGLMFLGAGVGLLGLGFVLTFVTYHSDASAMQYIMYSMTGLGATSLMVGLYDLFN